MPSSVLTLTKSRFLPRPGWIRNVSTPVTRTVQVPPIASRQGSMSREQAMDLEEALRRFRIEGGIEWAHARSGELDDRIEARPIPKLTIKDLLERYRIPDDVDIEAEL